ncbi:carbohydrate ABC transporter permease [Oceanithermus sp.]|uniref:carbohydrate ABC transporter permease n=1 Tax=Oceanithermus sp. TaxID=2268145 RepID=UPI00257FAADF|nr:carbohydrate ABC transporter permease [Oceanithermus sp.]
MNTRLRHLLGRIFIYAVLTAGAVVMAFPFYWMIATSVKSPQEAQQAAPIWFPERIQPANWRTAWRLGAEGDRPWWGGFAPGRTVTLHLRVEDPGAGRPRARVPKPPAVFSDPRSESTRILIEPAEGGWKIVLENAGTQRFTTLPLVVWIPKDAGKFRSELPPDAVRSQRGYWRLEWVNVSPGLFGYLFHNYREAWHAAPFARYFFVSFFTAGTQVLGGLIIATMAAFAFARIRFPGREAVFLLFVATMMIPGEVLLIPNYILLAKLGWLDTFYALIVPWLASVFGIFLLRQFFLSLPQDLFDAARIDGASYWGMLWRIAFPLAVPGLVTYGIFAFLGAYNALLWPLIVTQSPEMRTIQVGLQAFIGEAGSDYGQLMAASTMAILPIVLGYFFAQRHFIQGIARSGIK